MSVLGDGAAVSMCFLVVIRCPSSDWSDGAPSRSSIEDCATPSQRSVYFLHYALDCVTHHLSLARRAWTRVVLRKERCLPYYHSRHSRVSHCFNRHNIPSSHLRRPPAYISRPDLSHDMVRQSGRSRRRRQHALLRLHRHHPKEKDPKSATWSES